MSDMLRTAAKVFIDRAGATVIADDIDSLVHQCGFTGTVTAAIHVAVDGVKTDVGVCLDDRMFIRFKLDSLTPIEG